jgi:hypothetical protein
MGPCFRRDDIKYILNFIIPLDNFLISDYPHIVPFLQGGGSRSSRYAERDAVDADEPLTNGFEADGQVVWS